MKCFFIRLALLFNLFVAVSPVLAQPDDAKKDHVKVTAWLKAADFRALDEYFADVQRRYESGKIDDWSVLVAYQPFYEVAPENETLHSAWIKAFPNSYAAHLARGIYFRKVGEEKRGGKYASETSWKKMAGLHKYLDLAEIDLLASMKLAEKPILSVLHLLNISMHRGDSANANRHWLRTGNRIDPNNFSVRRRYMLTLTPRWGGSYPQMEAFLSQSKREGVPDQTARIFESMIFSDQASLAEKEQPERALGLYRKALDLLVPSRLAAVERGDALRDYIRVSHRLQRIEHALPEINEVLQTSPDDAYVVRMRAWALERQHKMAESWVEYKRAAALNDAWSQFIVGRTYYLGEPGYVAQDKNLGVQFLSVATKNGSKDARKFLAELPAAERR